MLRTLIAVFLAAAPAAALAEAEEPGKWSLAGMPGGCIVQAVSPGGTMLSIWGFAGESELGFLLQNPEWERLRDGARYPLQVDFAGAQSWPVEATARTHIDKDGPGFFFSLAPGEPTSNGFIESLTSAEDMSIRREGRVDTLPLAGSRGAIGELARCLSDRWVDVPAAPPAAEVKARPLDSI